MGLRLTTMLYFMPKGFSLQRPLPGAPQGAGALAANTSANLKPCFDGKDGRLLAASRGTQDVFIAGPADDQWVGVIVTDGMSTSYASEYLTAPRWTDPSRPTRLSSISSQAIQLARAYSCPRNRGRRTNCAVNSFRLGPPSVDSRSLGDEVRHGPRDVLEDGCPFVEVAFSLGCQPIHTTGWSASLDIPLRHNVPVRLQLAKCPVEGTTFDLGIRKGMILEIRRQIVSVRTSFLLEKEQNYRLDKPVQVSHGTCARLGSAVPVAYTIWHDWFSSLHVYYIYLSLRPEHDASGEDESANLDLPPQQQRQSHPGTSVRTIVAPGWFSCAFWMLIPDFRDCPIEFDLDTDMSICS